MVEEVWLRAGVEPELGLMTAVMVMMTMMTKMMVKGHSLASSSKAGIGPTARTRIMRKSYEKTHLILPTSNSPSSCA